MSDKDRGFHEVWCDTQNNISEFCNCLASGYIDKIEELEKQNAELKLAYEQSGHSIGEYIAELTRKGKELCVVTGNLMMIERELKANLKIAVEALKYYKQGAPVIGFDRGEKASEALSKLNHGDADG